MPGEDTRERFIKATGELLRRHGYHGTGLNDIIRMSGAPRGSLYHYFPGGKDQLVMEALRAAGEHIADMIREILRNRNSIRAGIGAVFDALAQEFQASNYSRGCPVAATALAVAADNEEIRAVCVAVYASWTATVQEFLMKAGMAKKPAGALARLAVQEYEGALLFARIQRSTTPLREARDRVLKATPIRK